MQKEEKLIKLRITSGNIQSGYYLSSQQVMDMLRKAIGLSMFSTAQIMNHILENRGDYISNTNAVVYIKKSDSIIEKLEKKHIPFNVTRLQIDNVIKGKTIQFVSIDVVHAYVKEKHLELYSKYREYLKFHYLKEVTISFKKDEMLNMLGKPGSIESKASQNIRHKITDKAVKNKIKAGQPTQAKSFKMPLPLVDDMEIARAFLKKNVAEFILDAVALYTADTLKQKAVVDNEKLSK